LVNKKAKHSFVVNSLKVPESTAYVYLKYLLDNQIVEKTRVGHEYLYTVRDENRVAKILVAYRSSFLDRLIDSVASVWLDAYFQDGKP
jgi:predicted transcriptional regulator